MRKILPAVALAAAALAAASLAGVGAPQTARGDSPPPGRTVTTTGHGVVTATPDVATVTAGVRVEADAAADALARASAVATKVIAAVRAAGGRDVRTAALTLEPLTNAAGRTTGYAAENDVTAVAAVAAAGDVVDAAARAGATTIGGVDLTVTDPEALYRQALARALADARAKAAALAAAGSFTVGPVQAVTESSTAPVPTPLAAGTAKAATPVEAGTQDVEADVQVTFAIG